MSLIALAVTPSQAAIATAPTGEEDLTWRKTEFPARFGGLSAIDVEGDTTMAIGFRIAKEFRFTALAASWDGERWQRLHVPVGDAESEVQLTDLDLRTERDGWVVGHRFDGTGSTAVAARWNGSSWEATPTDTLDDDIGFHGVAAVGRDDVWAAGQLQVGFTLRPTLAHFDGETWAPVEIPPLEGVGPHTALLSIAAESPNSVWAVGSGGVGLHYDGHEWTQVELPRIDGQFVELSEVRVFGADDVWAVGSRNAPDAELPVALHWDGGVWKIIQVPADEDAQLLDVARTPNGTVAVGYQVSDKIEFYGLRLDPDGPAKPLRLPRGRNALFAAATNPAGTELWVVGSGSVGDQGEIRPFAALRS